MLELIIKRIFWSIPVLWMVATLTFLLLHIVPGGPFDMEKNLPPAIVANIKAKYHLDRPFSEQYLLYLERLAHGDLGVSYKYVNRTVSDILGQAFPVSAGLGIMGLTIAILIGMPLGTLAALRRGTGFDYGAMLASTIGISVPSFLSGVILIMVFGIWLKILPVALWESGRHMILPAITLSFVPAAYISRLTRASVLEMLSKDWVRTAHLKGMPLPKVIIKHVLRNALIPVVTILGPIIAMLITGSFVVEFLYAIPGMGRFFVTAVTNRDYDLVMGTTLVFAVLLIFINTLVDIAYTLIDPRISVKA